MGHLQKGKNPFLVASAAARKGSAGDIDEVVDTCVNAKQKRDVRVFFRSSTEGYGR